MVRVLILLLLLYVAILLLVAGTAIGLGFLLHALIPDVDLGMAMIIGTATSLGAAYFFVKAIHAFSHLSEEMRDEHSAGDLGSRRRRRDRRRLLAGTNESQRNADQPIMIQ